MSAAKDILSLLQDMGESLTLVKVTSGAYNPATSSATETPANHTITAAVVNYKLSQIDGSLILRGDRKAIIAASGLTVTPAVGDKITGLGDTVRLIDVHTIREDGTTIAYIAQVRE